MSEARPASGSGEAPEPALIERPQPVQKRAPAWAGTPHSGQNLNGIRLSLTSRVDAAKAVRRRGGMAVRTEQAVRDNLRPACARWAPDALSGARILCGPAFVAAFASTGSQLGAGRSARAAAPLAIAAVACLTDFVDGRLARWLGGGSGYGAALDVAADAAFLLCALIALARGGLISAALPIATALSLLALFGSRAGRSGPASPQRRGTADLVGHGAGIANFAVVVAASAAHAGLAPSGWLGPVSLLVAAANLVPILLRRFEG